MNAEEREGREAQKTRKRPPHQKRNPIEAAITCWYEKHEIGLKSRHALIDLIAQAPKRWTAYGPLVLLPAGAFTSAAWRDVLDLAANPSVLGPLDDETEKTGEGDEKLRGPTRLWKTILEEIAVAPKARLTHLAINEGIPLRSKASDEGTDAGARAGGHENILRSPSGLRMLYGDFGPSTLSTPISAARQDVLQPEEVAGEDFSRAFWVSTKQNGIMQTWAPRWTMFSRGNVKEKARLLGFHDSGNSTTRAPAQQAGDLSHRRIPARRRLGALAVDLYAGIGYFAFCYAALGFRVLCWELNAWSVEGLRRGAVANGWRVRVVRPPSERSGETEGDEGMLREVLAGDETIVVFLEDNARAAGRIRRLDRLTREREIQRRGDGEDTDGINTGLRMSNVMHVNCGLLPTSRGAWATAWDIASEAQRAWFHVHENVGVSDIEAKKEEIREWFAERARGLDGEVGARADVCAEHVELVKTFAPGVWHCVFDLYVRRFPDRNGNIT
ncbi:S-adenosyl-L-methionine-dependent methyltransferase [Ustulina deusta]|nr:S-adenosyl-L-methionine-dependent methyltransferase [Ustulina deusta]